jgi:methionine sulfoxide reductase heme-binding subunit
MPRPIKPRYQWLSPGVLVGALIPLALLIIAALRGTIGADPVAISLNRLGLLALILLLASMAASPLRLVFHINWPMRLRRLLGLLAFFYASLHFLLYALVDQGFDLRAIVADVTERKFIAAGFLALVILTPLAITSTARMRKRLGAVRWQRLHRGVYLAGALASVHFVWRVKKDLTQPLWYMALLAVLLAVRVIYRRPGAAEARARRQRLAD